MIRLLAKAYQQATAPRKVSFPTGINHALVEAPFRPTRPIGLGQMPAQLARSGRELEIVRQSTLARQDLLARCTSYVHKGQIKRKGPGGDIVGFNAGETVGPNGELVCSLVVYESPIEQSFRCPQVGLVSISEIVKIETEYSHRSDRYITIVITASGDRHTFVTSGCGIVIWYDHGRLFYSA
ncbi:MAG TPA: hypothetical protein V6D08_09410 [Candidatus Obscuribacterales bacterium]